MKRRLTFASLLLLAVAACSPTYVCVDQFDGRTWEVQKHQYAKFVRGQGRNTVCYEKG